MNIFFYGIRNKKRLKYKWKIRRKYVKDLFMYVRRICGCYVEMDVNY